jgi:hypothetical protein
MPPPKVQKVKVKVKAISANSVNDPNARKTRKTTPQEYAAIQNEKARLEKSKKEEERAKVEERARQAEVARGKALTSSAVQVEELTPEDGPQTIASCVARTLGIPELKPKEVLAQAVQLMPEVSLDSKALPKAQLLQLVRVLIERRVVKRAADFEEQKAEKAAQAQVLAAEREAAEARAQEKAAEAAEAAAQAEMRGNCRLCYYRLLSAVLSVGA